MASRGFRAAMAGACLAFVWAPAKAEPFVIARGGKAVAAIVLGEHPCAASTNMAATLREMLERVTARYGATLWGVGTEVAPQLP
jgi:hypothetical protein